MPIKKSKDRGESKERKLKKKLMQRNAIVQSIKNRVSLMMDEMVLSGE